MIKLVRFAYGPKATLSYLYLEGKTPLYTVEPPWMDNERNESCIPEGTYILEKHNSHTHGQTFKLQNVPNRTGILFHSGNSHLDTKGCIIPGLSLNGWEVKDSRLAMDVICNVLSRSRYELHVSQFSADYG